MHQGRNSLGKEASLIQPNFIRVGAGVSPALVFEELDWGLMFFPLGTKSFKMLKQTGRKCLLSVLLFPS